MPQPKVSRQMRRHLERKQKKKENRDKLTWSKKKMVKKIPIYRWEYNLTVSTKNGETEIRRIRQDSLTTIEMFYSKIPDGKRPIGIENFRMMRRFVDSYDEAKRELNKRQKEWIKEYNEEMKKLEDDRKERLEKGEFIDQQELYDFIREHRLETYMILDNDIYKFIVDQGINVGLDSLIAFDPLVSDAIEAILDAKDYVRDDIENASD